MTPENYAADRYSNACQRWARLGPYYAMFPVGFAFETIARYSRTGGSVLDPFAGRASSIYAAAATGRHGIGIEINPVGWIYGKTKLSPASMRRTLSRIVELQKQAAINPVKPPTEFFQWCFAPNVFSFLTVARSNLDWMHSKVDRTVMGFLLTYLHGKAGDNLSNQMRQAKAMSPDYSVRWWKEHGFMPEDRDVLEFFRKRIRWRYRYGIPELSCSELLLGDSSVILERILCEVEEGKRSPITLVFTSPPYHGVTDYHYDQWVRLWLLGGSERPTRLDWEGPHRKRFVSKEQYQTLLNGVFTRCAEMSAPTVVAYIRTDARPFTLETTVDALRSAFPRHRMKINPRPSPERTQTTLFGDRSPKPGEVDIVLRATRSRPI